jgi:hypothetical protein
MFMYKDLVRMFSCVFFILVLNSSALKAKENPYFILNNLEKIKTNEKPLYKVDFSYEFNERDTIYIDELGVIPAKGHFVYLTHKQKIEFKDSADGSILETIELKKLDSNSEPSNNEYAANAGCTIVDATTQVAIHGSRTPAQQDNNVTTSSDDNCFNNNIVGETTQVGVSPGQVVQSNTGEYFVGGGDANNTGLTTPNVTVTPQTQVDVYSPDHVQQNNQADYSVGGDVNNTGVTTPNVTVTPQTQVDIYSPTIEIPDEKDFLEVTRHEDWNPPPIFQKAALEILNKFFPSGVQPYQRYNTIFFITPYVDLKTVPDNLNSQVALLISFPLSLPDKNNFFRIQLLPREKRKREAKWTSNVSDNTIQASNNFINEIIKNLEKYHNRSK